LDPDHVRIKEKTALLEGVFQHIRSPRRKIIPKQPSKPDAEKVEAFAIVLRRFIVFSSPAWGGFGRNRSNTFSRP
jgi:hypothetical protein